VDLLGGYQLSTTNSVNFPGSDNWVDTEAFALTLLNADGTSLLACESNYCYEVDLTGATPLITLRFTTSDSNQPMAFVVTKDFSRIFLFEDYPDSIYYIDTTTWTWTRWEIHELNNYIGWEDAVITSDDQYIYASMYNKDIYKIHLSSTCLSNFDVSTCTETWIQLSNKATGVALSGDGMTLFAYSLYSTMYRIDVNTKAITTINHGCSDVSQGRIRMLSDGQTLYVMGRNRNWGKGLFDTTTDSWIGSPCYLGVSPSPYNNDNMHGMALNQWDTVFILTKDRYLFSIDLVTRQAGCPCNSGFYDNAGTCEAACAADYYGTEFNVCTQCPTGQVSPAGSDAEDDCGCAAGTYLQAGGMGPLSLGSSSELSSIAVSHHTVSSFTRLPGTNYAFLLIRHQILRIDLTSGDQTIVAGQSTSGLVDGVGTNAQFQFYSECHGLALNDDNTILYVSDNYNNKIRNVDITSIPSTVTSMSYTFPASYPDYHDPRDIFWKDGHLYVMTEYGAIHKCDMTADTCTLIISSSNLPATSTILRMRTTSGVKVLFTARTSTNPYTIPVYEIADIANGDYTFTLKTTISNWQDIGVFSLIDASTLVAAWRVPDTWASYLNIYDLNNNGNLLISSDLGYSSLTRFAAWDDGYVYHMNANNNPAGLIKTYVGGASLPDQCTACPAGKTSLFNSDAEEDCQCAAGSYSQRGPVNGFTEGDYAVSTPTISNLPDMKSGNSKYYIKTIAFGPNSDLLYVQRSYDATVYPNVFVLDVSTNTVVDTLQDTDCVYDATSIAVSPVDQNIAFFGTQISSVYEQHIVKWDRNANTCSVLFRPSNCKTQTHVSISNDNNYLLVCCTTNDNPGSYWIRNCMEYSDYDSTSPTLLWTSSDQSYYGTYNGLSYAPDGFTAYLTEYESPSSRKIMKIDISSTRDSGTLSSWVTNLAGYHYPFNLLVDPTNTFIYIINRNEIVKVNIADQTSNIVAGSGYNSDQVQDGIGTSAWFNDAYGIAMHYSGSIWVGETMPSPLRKIEAGTVTYTPGDCLSCPTGATSPDFSTSISDCQCGPGYTGTDTCTLCAENSVKPTSGSGACTPCAEGTVSNAARTACVCGPGQEPDGAGGCDPCPSNHYKSAYTDDACLECRWSSATDSTGTNADYLCKCIPGYYNEVSQTNDCEPCAMGTYKTTTANLEACLACPTGSTTNATGKDELEDCICDLGYTGTGGASCVACAAGEYKASTGSVACTTCPVGSTSPEASTASTDCVCESPAYTGDPGGPCTCSPGYFLQSTPSNWNFESRTPYLELSDGQATGNLAYLGSKNLGSSIVVVSSSIPTSEGILWEIGGGGAGAVFYVEGSVPTQYLHISAGAGDAFKTSSDDKTAIIRIPLPDSRIPQDGTIVELALIVTQPGEIKLYIDKVFIDSASCTQFCHATCTGTSTYYWHGNDNAKLNGISGGVVVNNLQSTSWQGSISGTLKFYEQIDDEINNQIYFDGNLAASGCTSCEANSYCLGGETQSSCPPNSVSPAGSDALEDCQCDAGYTGDASSCSECSANQYKDALGSAACSGCPPNTNSPAGSTDVSFCAANAGYYLAGGTAESCPENSNSVVGSTASTDCKCNVGYTGPDGGACTACAAGKYKDASGSNACADCPVDSNSDVGSTLSSNCSCNLGYTGPDGGACTACAAGEYKDSTGPSVCIVCPENTNSNTASTSLQACVCKQGFSGPDGGPCLSCATGTFKDALGSSDCSDCPNNSNSPAESTAITDCMCNNGYSGDDGTPCIECPANQYEDTTTNTCETCPDNSISPTTSDAITDCLCDMGHYLGTTPGNLQWKFETESRSPSCTLTQTASTACGTGTTSAIVHAKSSIPASPTTGMLWEIGGAGAGTIFYLEYINSVQYLHVSAGAGDVYKTESDTTTAVIQIPLPDSRIKQDGTVVDIAMVVTTPGTIALYIDKVLIDTESCTNFYASNQILWHGADAGRLTGNSGSSPTVVNNLASLTWSGTIEGNLNRYTQTSEELGGNYFDGSEGISGCGECEAGTYKDVVGDNACTPCHDNSISPAGSTSADACLCEKGYRKIDGNCQFCGIGEYKDTISDATSCSICEFGTTLQIASTSVDQCLCNPGTYKVSGDPFQCDVCPVGSYTDTQNTATTCTQCPDNTLTNGLAKQNIDDCLCTYDFTAPDGGACVACESGKYKSILGSSSCVNCPTGSTCVWDPDASSKVVTCNAGYTADGTGCSACVEGQYKPLAGPGTCDTCPSNSISPLASTALTDCQCNAGYSGPDGGTCTECTANSYKDVIGSSACVPCTLYSTSPAGSDNVTDCVCDSGYVHAGDGSCDRVCAAGFEANFEESSCVGCGNGKYKPAAGDESCTLCPEHASHSLYNQTDITACVCEHGFIFNSETQLCDACETGKFNNYGGETRCFDCYSDTSGDCIASNSGTTSCTDICQAAAGYQIASDTTNVEICPAHTYNDGSYTTCQTCPDGSDTSAEGSTSVLDCECQPGYFRNTNSVCEACAIGTFKTGTGDPACSTCPDDMTTLTTASTACVCAAGFEPNADNTACQACPAGEAKFVAGNVSCILCTNHSTLQSDLPHQISSCLCNPGYTGSHLSCSPCDVGFFKNSYDNSSCTECTEYATTASAASTSITACTCEELYEPHPDGGPDQPDGSCISSCNPGTFKLDNTCANCSQGFYKDVSGPQECTPCPDPRNASDVGADSIQDCSCHAGEMALGGNTATLDSIQGYLDLNTISHTCTAIPCSFYSNHANPLKEITVSTSILSLTIHLRTTTTSLLLYQCETESLCQGLTSINLPTIRAEYVDIVATSNTPDIFNYISIHAYTRADASFSNTNHAWWDLEQAQTLVSTHNMQPGESIFDSNTAIVDNTVCVTCERGLICEDFIKQ
tara:strand:+ start:22706 stop:31351 length:8646 start_codon:yes stop_codon:yes gene_type:complete